MTDVGAETLDRVAYRGTSSPDDDPAYSAISLRILGRSRQVVEGDPIEAAVALLQRGEIIAIKGPGGCQLACDAANPSAVARLRAKKRHHARPFALMARDISVIRRYCAVSHEEERALTSVRAPIVLLTARPAGRLPNEVAPHLSTLGFMLPATSLHHALLRRMHEPLVMTNGNLWVERRPADDNVLADIASHVLAHEDVMPFGDGCSVVRIMDNELRVLRGARGHAPVAIALPSGFETATGIVALGPDSVSCLIRDGQAILSHGHPDAEFHSSGPHTIAGDMVPSPKSATPRLWVQHHHAHVASCLCENGYPLDGPRVLGIALDGLGWGSDGTWWGGEFLLADYRGFRRLAALRPIALPGAARATREPWRALYAHIAASMGWQAFSARFAEARPCTALEAKPRRTLDAMIAKDINAPLASSCSVLFDAVAAALGLTADRQSGADDAAALLEAIADRAGREDAPYDFALSGSPVRFLDPAPMWRALFTDLGDGIGIPTIAARFHAGLARAIADTAVALARSEPFHVVALSGACLRNRVLFEQLTTRLTASGFVVLTHARVPADDGGLALGQAAVAAASLLPRGSGERAYH